MNKNKQKNSFHFHLIIVFAGLGALLFLLLPVTYLFVAQPFQIVGNAMEPNYSEGEFYFANKAIYKTKDPERGDVVVFKATNNACPSNVTCIFFKRVVGLPGDRVLLVNGRVMINGEFLDEEAYLSSDRETLGSKFIREGVEVTIPNNEYMMLGDLRSNSSDSRVWGFVPRENIRAKMWFCYANCK